MIIGIIILSLLFIGIGFIVTENNAKYLLSGYNTMSENERKNIDIKSYIPYFRNFHVFLGISLFIIGAFLYYYVDSDWSGIFMGTYPFLAYIYFIWKGNKFNRQNDKKLKRKSLITIGFMFTILITVSAMFYYSLKDNKIEINNDNIVITGDYGIELKTSDIKSIKLVNQFPEISYKMNGFALENVKKGYFKTKEGEKVKLLINSLKQPLICITTNKNENIYYSAKDKSNEIIYNNLKSSLKK